MESLRIPFICSQQKTRTIQSISLAVKLILRQSNSQYCTKSEIDMAIPRAVLPSSRVVANSKNSNKFLRLLLELELLYGAAKAKLPTYFTDSDWMKYIKMTSVIERCCYLHQLYESRKETEEKHEKKKRREIETAFNRSFPIETLYYFGREDFRRFAYEEFGCRLLAAWRCRDSFPPLLVDCRYLADLNYSTQRALVKQMKDLVLDNSLRRNPFPVVFVNYHIKVDIAEEVVNSWLRNRCISKYHPSIVNGSEWAEELSDKESDQRLKDHIAAPFVPVVTSATVRECLGCTSPEEIAYINPRAAEYLPFPLSKYKAFILCATPDNKLMNSAFQAAKTEHLGQAVVTMPLRITANVIRDVYAVGCDWRTAFEKHIPYFNTLAGSMYRNHDNDNDAIEVMGQWLSDVERKGKRKRKLFHAYNREERRAARALFRESRLSKG